MSQRIFNGQGVVVEDYSPANVARATKLEAFRATVANMSPYKFADGSWTDDQAEDAIVSLNRLIAEARKLAPRKARANG